MGKHGFVPIGKSKHGVPPPLPGKAAQAKICFGKVGLSHSHKLPRSCPRSFEKSSGSMGWRGYADLLARKPRAAENARFSGQMPELWQEHARGLEGRGRKPALLVLGEMAAGGNGAMAGKAPGEARLHGRAGAGSILARYCIAAKKQPGPKPLQLPGGGPVVGYKPGLAAYGFLSKGGGK